MEDVGDGTSHGSLASSCQKSLKSEELNEGVADFENLCG
jgi:hypothetical protein